METTFYCFTCGLFKPLSQKRSAPSGRPRCATCGRKVDKAMRRSDKAKEARRAKLVGKIEHLLPKTSD